MHCFFGVVLGFFSSLGSRGKQVRMASLGQRINTSCLKPVRLVLVRG